MYLSLCCNLFIYLNLRQNHTYFWEQNKKKYVLVQNEKCFQFELKDFYYLIGESLHLGAEPP